MQKNKEQKISYLIIFAFWNFQKKHEWPRNFALFLDFAQTQKNKQMNPKLKKK